MPSSLKISEANTRRKLIDKALKEAGWWPIIDFADFVKGVRHETFAVSEYETPEGPADYVLFHNGRAVAAVEAKKLTLGPQNVLSQAQRYARGFRNGRFRFANSLYSRRAIHISSFILRWTSRRIVLGWLNVGGLPGRFPSLVIDFFLTHENYVQLGQELF